jgi:hypothetical protein
MMAIVAAFTISFSIASMASMTGLLPQAKVDPQSPSFIAPLASQMHEAVMLAAASAAVQYAPAAQQDALTPHGAAASAAP